MSEQRLIRLLRAVEAADAGGVPLDNRSLAAALGVSVEDATKLLRCRGSSP
jgi:hypothetical protein